jgi:F-type H+-transporting ATPase subunit delta
LILRFARPYAQALLKRQRGNDEAMAVRADLANFVEAMTKVPGIAQMAANPGIPMATKKSVTSDIVGQLGLGKDAKNFIDLLLGNDLLNQRLGRAVAAVTSAHPLDDTQRASLKKALEQKLGKTIELQLEVDPGLLGGFVALVGSDRYDVSLRGQLDRLSRNMADGE